MYFSAMPSLLRKTEFVTNLHATPAEWQRDLFYSVVRAGHLRGGIDHRIERETYPGHELMLCIRGKGWVRVAGRRHEVSAAQLVWVNCHHAHAYGAVTDDPWELYWLRAEGRSLDRIAQMLQVRTQPVLDGVDCDKTKPFFERIFSRMQSTKPGDTASCDAAVAEIIAIAFETRPSLLDAAAPELPPAVVKALEQMRLYYHKPTRVAELASMAGMSESHFSRMFKAAMGTSPIDWLRRERINQAKRRLVESSDAIKEVAQQVGYSDQFFFSKDFKRMTTLTPTQFRQTEGKA
jgi:AraC family transcriptional regulator, arabinose operon regulatory protein